MTPNVVTTVLAPAKPLFKGGAPRDLCSLESVHDELDLQSERNRDRWLREQISAESENIENHCNRVFQTQWYEDRVWPFRDSEPRKFEQDLLPLQLSRWPIHEAVCRAEVAPPRRPTLSLIAGGALPAARYYVRCTYVTAQGETAASLEANVLAASGELPQVASPAEDWEQMAIGWNCYVGIESNCLTLQNAEPLSIGQSFSAAESGLVPGAPIPTYILLVEEGVRAPDGTVRDKPLAEGRDFIVDRREGQLIRLHPQSRHARSFSTAPLIVQYHAGFPEIPRAVRLSAVELVKFRWFSRKRDPGVRSENVPGIYQAAYWLGTGPGGPADMPASVADRLELYRVPVIA